MPSDPKAVLVEFQSVGRERRSWTERVPDFSFDELYRAVRRGGALRSTSIDFGDEGADGWHTVFAGFHAVGRLRRVIRAVEP